MNNINVINRYDNMLYESRPATINEFISNKYNDVHNELFNDALNKYIYNIVSKNIDYNFIYNFYQTIANIAITDNDKTDFEYVYDYFDKNDNTLKTPLNNLGIDQKVCLKLLYDIMINKLIEVKNKLINYGKDIEGNLISIIDGVTSISNINDFRFAYNENVEVIALENSPNEVIIDASTLSLNEDNNLIFNASQYLLGSEKSIDDGLELPINRQYNDFVIIYEDENGIRIGYNRLGEWILFVNKDTEFNNILNIDNVRYHVEKYMKTKSKSINDLYIEAVCKLYKKYHKIVEIKNSEYWKPSSIFIIDRISPFQKHIISLSKYWNMIQSNETSELEDLKISSENILDSELIEINYVTGKAKLQSRTNDLIYEVPFKYLNENINVSDDMILSNSFISKYNTL